MMMRPTGNLDELMAELRREHQSIEAPERLEMILSAEAKARSIRRAPVNRVWAWGLGLVLVGSVVVVAVEWNMHRVHAPESRKTQADVKAAPAPDRMPGSEAAATRLPEHSGELAAVRRGHSRPAKDDARPAAEEASLGDFVPLPASEGLPPVSAISLVRMRIEQNSLQQYGLEVPAEAAPKTLLAEFVVGEDGLPRAIRIIP